MVSSAAGEGVAANCGLFRRRSFRRGGTDEEGANVGVAGVAVGEGATGMLACGLIAVGGVGLGRGVAVTTGDAEASAGLTDGEAGGLAVSNDFGWRRNGVGVADGGGVCAARAGWKGVAVAIGGVIGGTVAAGAGVAAGATDADADVAGAALASAAACAGFTKIFGGASGGGVASDFIFARVFSTACRSEIPSQPRSISTCATVSFTARGRSTA